VCDRVVIIDKGRVVTAGRPEELAAPRGVEIETARGVRTYDGARRDDVPDIVAGLVGDGERVYEVRILASTLEDVYLDAVGGREAERGKVPAA
jgi:ABC-type multidrug transport system ATPase subunit